ncbi:hypothetical protein ABZ936_06765, partial [Streptomyces sp. NPDC046685]
MSSAIPPLEIIVGDFPVDGAHIVHQGEGRLFLRPQTFGSAVRHVRNVLPEITLEEAQRLIREKCPEFPDLDDLLGANARPVPRVDLPSPPLEKDEQVRPRGGRRRQIAIAAALLPALAASWALGRYCSIDLNGPNRAPAAATLPQPQTSSQPAPFTDKAFTYFAGAGDIYCDPTSTLEAECTDADGKVMSTKAATGPDSTIFTFSYGSDQIGLRVFYDPAYAATWARQESTAQLYPHLAVHGRYALWGTDEARIKEYGQLLDEAASRRSPGPLPHGGVAPLPPRLAALTLGALGLDKQEVNQILAQPTSAGADTPVVMAARLVLGLDKISSNARPGGADIVAIAAGIVPPPPTTSPAPETDTRAVPPPTPAPKTTPAPEPVPTPEPKQPPKPEPTPEPTPTPDPEPKQPPKPEPTPEPTPTPDPEPKQPPKPEPTP